MTRSSSVGVQNTQWIPLRDDYFETPLLSAKEKAYLVRKSCEAAQEVVERARSTGGPIQWRHVEKYDEVQIYAGFSRGTYSAEPTSMCGVTTVPGTVAELAALFDLSTTRSMKDFGFEHPDLFYDAIVLYTLSPRTKEKPLHQVTAKWIAVKSPRGMDDRDYCYLECQDKFMDSTGRKGWVLCLHSIKLPGCDELSREFGFVRGSFYHSGIIVVESDRPGHVDVIHMLQINLKNNTKMPPTLLRERIAFIGRIKNMLRVKRLNEQRYLSDLELVPKKYRSRCNVCQDSFSLLLLRKLNCRKCGEVVCGACSKEFDITNAKFLETIKLRICMHCYQMVTAGHTPGQSIMDQPRPSTSLSLLGYHDDNQRASFITQQQHGQLAPQHHPYRGSNGTHLSQQPTRIYLQSMQDRPRRSSRHSQQQQQPYRDGSDAGSNHSFFGAHHHHHQQQYEYGRPTLPRQASAAGSPPRYSRTYEIDIDTGYEADNGGPLQPPPHQPPASLFDRKPASPTKALPPRSGVLPPRHRPVVSDQQQQQPRVVIPMRGSEGTRLHPKLHSYNAINSETARPEPPSSPRHDASRDSTSSLSSSDSIDVDVYNAAMNLTGDEDEQSVDDPTVGPVTEQVKKVGFQLNPSVVENGGATYDSYKDEGDFTEGSVGSDDELETAPSHRLSTVGRGDDDDSDDDDIDEETKSEEFSATPALPGPSPSAYSALQATLARESIDVPFPRRNYNVTDISVSTVNTVDHDLSYLGSMRDFHDQAFTMPEARVTIEQTRLNDKDETDVSRSSIAAPPKSETITSPVLSGMARPPLYAASKKGDGRGMNGARVSTPSPPPITPSGAGQAPRSSGPRPLVATPSPTSRPTTAPPSDRTPTRSNSTNDTFHIRLDANASLVSNAPSDEGESLEYMLSSPNPLKSMEKQDNQASTPTYVPSRFQRPSNQDTNGKAEEVSPSGSNQECEAPQQAARPRPAPLHRSQTFQLKQETPLPVDEESGSESERDVLSARKMYRNFGSTKRITRIVEGGESNQDVLKRLAEIQQSFYQLSSDEEDSS